jgi:type I restriction-modification system DNA methylase subunit
MAVCAQSDEACKNNVTQKGVQTVTNFAYKVSFIWNVADLLRGPYKPPPYGRVILPLTVLRRLDCVLDPTMDKVLAKAAELKGDAIDCLRDYRSSLISAVVTGQIDIRQHRKEAK